MTNSEATFQASLEVNLAEFEIAQKVGSSKVSKFQPFYDFLPKMEIGKVYHVTEEIGWDPTKDFDKHCSNLLYNARKNCKGYSLTGIVLISKTGVKSFAVKCNGKPKVEVVAMPEKEDYIVPIVDEDADFNG